MSTIIFGIETVNERWQKGMKIMRRCPRLNEEYENGGHLAKRLFCHEHGFAGVARPGWLSIISDVHFDSTEDV